MPSFRKVDRRRWELVRRQALDRDGWRCRTCGRAGRLEVDHVRPLRAGGARYHLDNLQALCRDCHHDKTVAEAGRRRWAPSQAAEDWRALVDDLT